MAAADTRRALCCLTVCAITLWLGRAHTRRYEQRADPRRFQHRRCACRTQSPCNSGPGWGSHGAAGGASSHDQRMLRAAGGAQVVRARAREGGDRCGAGAPRQPPGVACPNPRPPRQAHAQQSVVLCEPWSWASRWPGPHGSDACAHGQCGCHALGLAGREEAVARIRAAVDVRAESGADILIVARSDARQADSLQARPCRLAAGTRVAACACTRADSGRARARAQAWCRCGV